MSLRLIPAILLLFILSYCQNKQEPQGETNLLKIAAKETFTANTLTNKASHQAKIDLPIQTAGLNKGGILHQIQNEMRIVADEILPAVVLISVESRVQMPAASGYFNFSPQKVSAMGSGVVVAQEGEDVYILTNHHVVAAADSVSVSGLLDDSIEAEIVGSDKDFDLALIKLKTDQKVKVAKIGNSDNVRVGDWAIAVGNPLGLEKTLTVGFVSAIGREGSSNIQSGSALQSFIQTDAAINKGNSGGPLVNIDGEVIGINTQIVSQTGGSIGLGFSVTINQAVNFVNQIRTKGHVEKGFLGISMAPVTEDHKLALGLESLLGVVVDSVTPGSPAAKSGILGGDIITKVNDVVIADREHLFREIATKAPGDSVTISLLRNGKSKSVEVILTVRPNIEVNELGLILGELDENTRKQFKIDKDIDGVVILEATGSSQAAKSGILPGDVITQLNKVVINSAKDFNRELDKIGKKKPIFAFVLRNGRQRMLKIQ